MAGRTVIVIGGGPAGHSAALSARGCGAEVTLVEAEHLGGHCVHHTCIPNGLILDAVGTFYDSQELALAGVVDVGEKFNLSRAVFRKDQLVRKLANVVEASLRAAGVEVISGRARLDGPGRVSIAGASATETRVADAVVLAAGSRWTAPRLSGVAPKQVATLDEVSRLTSVPATALVLGGGPAGTCFGIEAAVMLAAGGSSVVYAATGEQLVADLDPDVDDIARAGLEALGIELLLGAALQDDPDVIGPVVAHSGGVRPIDAEMIVAPDAREPALENLGVDSVGLDPSKWLDVDQYGATPAVGVWAAGDVTGRAMLSSTATHGGRVSGANAAGRRLRLRIDNPPRLLHTIPPVAWVGLGEQAALAAGHDVVVSRVDLAHQARSVVTGGSEGCLKLVAERELRRVLGVQVVGAEAAEIVALASQACAMELRIDDLAETVQWHPSKAEALVAAAQAIQW